MNKHAESMSKEFSDMKKANADLGVAVQNLEKRIDAIFVVEPPVPATPNQATEQEAEGAEFSEDTVFNLPKDIRIEVEGGDTLIPPQYA